MTEHTLRGTCDKPLYVLSLCAEQGLATRHLIPVWLCSWGGLGTWLDCVRVWLCPNLRQINYNWTATLCKTVLHWCTKQSSHDYIDSYAAQNSSDKSTAIGQQLWTKQSRQVHYEYIDHYTAQNSSHRSITIRPKHCISATNRQIHYSWQWLVNRQLSTGHWRVLDRGEVIGCSTLAICSAATKLYQRLRTRKASLYGQPHMY